MKNLFLVIDSESVKGKFARVEAVDSSANLLKYANDKNIKSVSAYVVEKHAAEHAKALNKMYMERGEHSYL